LALLTAESQQVRRWVVIQQHYWVCWFGPSGGRLSHGHGGNTSLPFITKLGKWL